MSSGYRGPPASGYRGPILGVSRTETPVQRFIPMSYVTVNVKTLSSYEEFLC